MDIFWNLFVINTITLVYYSGFVHGVDILTSSQSLSDDTGIKLVSKEGKFQLGFFSPGSSTRRYLGIWFNNIPTQTVVWVANRQNPINDTSGLLRLNSSGNLVLVSQHNGVVWSSNSTKQARNPVFQLMDSGNLVIRDEQDGDSGSFLWQSFDYPSDTLLPGMKLGWDLRVGLDRHLSAWKSPDDPSPGDFTTGIALYNYPDAYGWKGSQKYFRAGPWNGLRYSGARKIRSSPNGNHNFQWVFSFNFVWNDEEVYNMFYLENKSVIARYVLNQTDNYQGQHYIWNSGNSTWLLYSYTPRDICDNYGHCGAYGSCDNTENPQCQCLKGFKPKSSLYWDSLDLNQGCERDKPLDCQKGDGFIKYGGLKLPDTTNSWVNRSMNLKECRAKCLQNCSCMAYANTNISEGGSGCALWFGDLIDIVQLKSGGQDLFIRMSASEIEKGGTKIKILVGIVISIIAVLLLVGCYIWRSRTCSKGNKENLGVNDCSNEGQEEDLESQLFPLEVIARATGDFSVENKLGEGGFGPVYKGTTEDGLEIAVKRLSRNSGQGSNEFKNEVALIAKLQHRNLVKLLGCCIQGEEKLLVYEYMPNKSLDFFIFDKTKSKLLDWHIRFHIICGIARGLDYLHHGSRLRIIHRDLKTSNILLDSEMSPKISDFGLARTFGGDQIEGNTSRVVGTYGYMAPEYAFDGQFSVKSDVFSFGVIVLEILSGVKNRGFYQPKQSANLISHAWRLWKEGRPLDMMDSFLQESSSLLEAVRCIQIGLLCLQQYPEDRPTMSSVIVMLSSETALTQPKEPGLLLEKRSPDQTDSSSSRIESSSTNEVSTSLLMGR